MATSAGRQARNQDQLIALGRRYGFVVEIISPEEEAMLSREGALFKLKRELKKAVVLDIGGLLRKSVQIKISLAGVWGLLI